MGDNVGFNGVGLTMEELFSGGELIIEEVSGIYGGTLQMVFCVRFMSVESVTLPSTLSITISDGRNVVTGCSRRSMDEYNGERSESASL